MAYPRVVVTRILRDEAKRQTPSDRLKRYRETEKDDYRRRTPAKEEAAAETTVHK